MTNPEDDISHCLNCGEELKPGPYCGACGQRNVHERLTWRELTKEFNTQLLEFDLPWARTLVDLTIRPSTVCTAYISGKRIPYVNPIKYVVYVIAFVTLVIQLNEFAISSIPGLPESAPFLVRIVFSNVPIYTLLFSPFAVLLLKIFFWKTLRNWVETTCYVFYMIGHSALMLLIVMFLLRLFLENFRPGITDDLKINLQGLIVLSLFIGIPLYWANAAKDFFVANHLWSWLVMFIVCYGYLSGGIFVYFSTVEFYGAFGTNL